MPATVEKLIAPVPAKTQVAPISPPNSACDELDGMPSSQVIKFQRIAPTSPPKITSGMIRLQARAHTWLCLMASASDAAGDPLEHGRAALAQYRKISDEAGLAHAQALVGFAMTRHGRPAEEAAMVDESVRAHQRLGDRWGLATALAARGWAAVGRGELDTARVDVEHSLELFRDIGDRWGQVRAGELLGYLLEVEGDYDRATQLHREGPRRATELGLWPIASQQLGRLGRLAALADNHPAAIERYEQALALATEIGFRQRVTFAHGGLGMVARRQGRLDDAERHFRIMLDIHREEGFRSGVVFALAHLGFIAAARADTTTARALQREALTGARELGDQRAVAFAVEGLADAEAAAGEYEQAAELLGQAAKIRTDAGRPLPLAERVDVDRVAAAARTALDELAFEAAFARGAAPTTTVNPATTGRRSPGNRSRHTPDPRLRRGDPAGEASDCHPRTGTGNFSQTSLPAGPGTRRRQRRCRDRLLARLVQLLGGVLAHRLQQPVARRARGRPAPAAATCRPAAPAGRARRRAQRGPGADRLGRGEVNPPAKTASRRSRVRYATRHHRPGDQLRSRRAQTRRAGRPLLPQAVHRCPGHPRAVRPRRHACAETRVARCAGRTPAVIARPVHNRPVPRRPGRPARPLRRSCRALPGGRRRAARDDGRWGRGLATEAAVAMTRLADDLGMIRLHALCHPDNTASARVLAKAGFLREGVLRPHTCFPNIGLEEPQDVEIWARVIR